MGIFDRLFKDILESSNGRIYTTSGCWMFDPSPKLLEKSRLKLIRNDDTGREMKLVGKPGVHCPNPEVCSGKYPKYKDKDMWSIPACVCRKCQYYSKSTRAIRYSHCLWRKAKNGGAFGAIAKTTEIVNKALEETDKIMNSITAPPLHHQNDAPENEIPPISQGV